eukprot:CAMPEP_0172423820 /NCGR_PEP_ID=MMETSP1064-20121228/17759_1 /TAXON_ID=202472 /ORGANISM="Aulacoseira subarctica , Strain CCAP 1002/5" /LENGTH=472 /DNA_ID=CAMNT_0013165367 /DNA_START=67 /DNA_END=1485 /DNA_ORIENTATION=-
MRFGKTLREKTISEWRFYCVDYKQLKQVLNGKVAEEEGEEAVSQQLYTTAISTRDGRKVKVSHEEFFATVTASEDKLRRFYKDKADWALQYLDTLAERVELLRQAAATTSTTNTKSNTDTNSTTSPPSSSSTHSLSPSSCDSFNDLFVYDLDEEKQEDDSNDANNCTNINSPPSASNTRPTHTRQNSEWLKEQYRLFANSQHFHAFIYAKKSLATYMRELNLLLEFLQLNTTAMYKILKKFDKVTSSNIREEYMQGFMDRNAYLLGGALTQLKRQVQIMIDETELLKPSLPEGWEDRKVYTIGCFDLFHRGHQNVLLSLREFGNFIVAGIHDDESYFKLKGKYPIDNLEKRIECVKPFVDQLFVIPSTDPLIYIKSMVSTQDIELGRCCYARGDDMLHFPSREWVETVMPVHFVPRTEACSSTLIRTIYHDADETLRSHVAFAKTRTSDGKPIDENGQVINLYQGAAATCQA